LPLEGYLKVLEKKHSLISNTCSKLIINQTVNTPTNNPNVVMSAFLRPLNFAAIQGAPHAIPDKAIEKLPCFQGNNAISAHSHILNFNLCVLKYCRGHDEEDVKMTLFVYSLEGDALNGLLNLIQTSFAP
jgi:hypothetical protein